MKSKQRQKMDDLVSQKIKRIQENRNPNPELTGRETIQAILGIGNANQSIPEERKSIVLYLREGLKGADKNFTKYPNNIHEVMQGKLQEEAEGILYIYLWRLSWGYGKNFCRIGYSNITKHTIINSRNTARRAIASLIEKQFIIKALDEKGKLDVTQDGTLYRILMPEEIETGVTEEGCLVKDIPLDGVPMLGIPNMDIPENAENMTNRRGMSNIGIPNMATVQDGHTQNGHTAVSNIGIPNMGIPTRNLTQTSKKGNYAQNGHTQNGHGLKENKDSLKDSLSQEEIISKFYDGIGQNNIPKAKRESAEKSFQKLLGEGFKSEDIEFAVEWTLKNVKEKMYDFSIVCHTIGEAMAAKEKEESENKRKVEQQKMEDEKKAEEERQEREQIKLEEYKAGLSEPEKKKLRERAMEKISEENYSREYINPQLISFHENKILKKEIGK